MVADARPVLLALLAVSSCGGLTVWDGTLEEAAKRDVRYWVGDAKYPAAAWADACASVTHDGRRGRVGRVYTADEDARVRALARRVKKDLGLDGTDRAADGRFAWSDGGAIWDEEHGCAQKFCNWAPGSPSDSTIGAGKDTMLLRLASEAWTDAVGASTQAAVLCEFPCEAHADCKDKSDSVTDPWFCHGTTRRCVKKSECSQYSPEAYEDGVAESSEQVDVAFWLSASAANRSLAENACRLMCKNGSVGRLARVLSPAEETRVNALAQAASYSGQAHVAGTDAAGNGSWAYSDGRVFWSASGGCAQRYCHWKAGEPANVTGGEDHLRVSFSAGGSWLAGGESDAAQRYVCEFPCYTDEECRERAGAGYMCHRHGRCVLKSACNAFGKTKLHESGTLDDGSRADVRLWYSGGSNKATRDNAENTCRDLCVDGKYGRLLQLQTREEDVAMKTLLGVDPAEVTSVGTDGLHVGGFRDAEDPEVFRWAPDLPFYNGSTPSAACRQQYCNWAPGEPAAGGSFARLDTQSQWAADAAGGTVERPWLCEFPCASDADCGAGFRCLAARGRCVAAAGAACGYGVAAYADGVPESNEYKDTRFWASNATYDWWTSRSLCGDLCFNGRTGRAARVYSLDEMERLQDLLSTAGLDAGWLGGSDGEPEGTWRWGDGAVMYSVDGGCEQKFCKFSPDSTAAKNGLVLDAQTALRDESQELARAALCEFPCASDDDCRGASGENYVCHYSGRCVLRSHCNPEGAYTVADGTLEADTSATIRFWHSKSIKKPYVEASEICRGLCLDGRGGQLARIMTADENHRANALSSNSKRPSFVDGTSTINGIYQWSDGSIVYVRGAGCEQGYCVWKPSHPRGHPHMALDMNGWFDMNGQWQQMFTCEFPCVGDADCNAGDDACPTYECTRHGRCVLNPSCFRDGKCSSFRAEVDCGSKDTCEWDQAAGGTGACVDAPCQYADEPTCLAYEGCEWSTACPDNHECAPKLCAAADSGACEADPRCAWSGAACELAACAEYTAESCCNAEIRCAWNIAGSPAFCALSYCAAAHVDKTGCGADLRCMWHGGGCVEVQCPLLDECNCKAHDTCLWDAASTACGSALFVDCPPLDVVVLVDGSFSMSDRFGRHPHGFYGLAEVLRDWVARIPLSGEKSGETAPGQPGGFRVGFVQYAATERTTPAAWTTAESGVGAKGELSGDRGELEADITWHEQNFIGGSMKIEAGLTAAGGMFAASDHGRPRVLFIFADGDIPDATSVAPRLAALAAQDVEIFGVAVRRFDAKKTDDVAAEASLASVVSAPAADHVLNLEIDDLKGSFLFDMCDPSSPFGSSIVSKTTEPVQVGIHRACPLYAESHNCTQDPGCTWHSVDQECVNSACVRLCTKAECQAETAHLCRWTDEGWCMKETVCAFTSEALCVGSTQLCDWNAGACEKTPCVSVGTEPECLADDADCTWWTINGNAKCIMTPCTATNGAVCEQDAKCQWATDPCNTTAGPVCELAGCSVYTVASECNGDPRCVMNNTQCLTKPCAEYAGELCCDRVPECGWDVSTSPATCQLKLCYTITQPASCGVNPECMWSPAEDRCVDLACAEYSDECACGQRESCFWKKGVPGLCTFSRYGMCPVMDVVVVFDGSDRAAARYGRHPDGAVGVLEKLREWAKGLPLSGESYVVGDSVSLATSAVRLSFLRFGSDGNGAAAVAAGNTTNGHLSGNWTELGEDLEWHEDNPSGGMPVVAAALSRAATVFEAGSPPSALRKRMLFIVTSGNVDTTGAKSYLNELDGLDVQRFGLLVQKAEVQSKPDVAAETTLRTLASPIQSHHADGTTIDTMLGALGLICDPNTGWGSQVLGQETPGKVSGARYPCEMYRLGSACAVDPGCVWSDGSSVCVDSPCLGVCDEDACPLVTPTNCTWAGAVCIDEPVLDCRCKYDGGDVDHNLHLCGADAACWWNATSSSCMIDECRDGTEGNTTCGNNRQRCVDPSWEPCSNDWYCDCIAPAVASSFGPLAVAECEVYECDFDCPTCEAGACGSEQICNDPDTSATSLQDWECVCQSPYAGVGSAKAATCRIDECVHACPHCENGTCAGHTNQACVDPDVLTRGDWECHCPFPTGISAVARQAADCDFDECAAYNETCSFAGQDCVDDNIFTLGNWECACRAPATGRGDMAVAPACYIDECAANCTTCANGACDAGVVSQTCLDNNTRSASLNDWMCTCPDGSSTAIAKPAICPFDECADSCPTCANTTCTSLNQSCADPSRLSNSLSDWRCECLYPSNATSPQSAVPSCDRDECELYASACTNADPAQLCVDPDESIAGDWYCDCVPPTTGNQTAGAAECSIDECEASCDTCEEDACNVGPLNQTCEDLDTSARSLSDWVCACPWSHASVNQSTTLGQAANCVFDECVDSCPSCAEGLCGASGQTCVDPNKRTYALNDWMCMCPVPSRAFNVSAAVLSCEFDECEDHGKVCTDAEQDCVDLDMGSGGHDWMCSCRLPTVGNATKGPAACLIDECTASCATCANDTCALPNPAQLCTDPNPSADSLSDWTCTCPFPSTKSALGKAANCPFNECDFTCSTCVNATCADANQTCTDPNPTALSVLDWICTCPLPSTAASVASRVASCDFDECTLYASLCLDAYNQTCEDPDLSVADDWQCHCSLPLEDVVAGRPASCRLDECEVTCDSCENGQCSSGPVAQTCTDPNPSSLSVFDWQCHCPAPSTVVGIKHAASCPFNECTQPCATCANGTCAAAGQTCADMLASSGSLGDWVCRCAPPSRASNVANAAAHCDFDECETHNRTCGVVNQTCSDPDQLVSDNWVCECQAPLRGNATAFYADCTIDECAESCASCEEGLCDGYGQDCEDPDASANSLSDWVCACKSPGEGRAVRARASCVLDECEVETDCDHCEKGACLAAGQTCRDPNTTTASTSDWTCSCVLPSTGTSVGQPASPCLLDECASDTNEDTCANHGQTCHDPQPYANSTGNWECHCVVPPALNESSAQAAFATCEYPGECETAPLAIQCLAAGNLCYDPDVSLTSLGDWLCMCAPPLKGANGSATNSIVCEIDECSEVCATCASTEAQPDNVCVLAGQTCDDPSYRTFHDWTCVCPFPASGTSNKTSPVLSCLIDECTGSCPTCAGTATGATCQGQTCRDPDQNVTSLSDWTCTCIDGVGSSTAAKAVCECDECLHTAVCTDKGQLCSDKDKSCPGQSDFECECTPPSVGSAVATFVVQCETDECESHGSSCDIAGQNCVDNDRTQFDDWACECPQPSSGSATGGIATCELNECLALCSHCENDACANATDHQKCTDPNISASSINDWTCTCEAPGVGSATASAAVCACDECAGSTVCSSEGQTCIDNVQSCAASGDFTCECAPPSNGSAAGKPAVCTRDECAQNTVCAAQNQGCSDPDQETANTWICECVPPFVGTGAQEAAACTVDECEEETCPTCEKGTCSLAGQTCEDPDTSATSLQDWTCTCTEGTGNATAKPATCTCNECIDNVLCLANGQTCVDRNTTCHGGSTPDFECRCQDPWEGAQVNGVATCEWDECAVNGTTCTSEGQTCEDTDLTSENTWRCVCPSPSTGSAVHAVASCVLDECETECAHCENDTCFNAGQQCADSNSDEKSKSDWTCTCNPPGIGKATQRAATCVCDECADDAVKGVCVSAGQACEDRNKTCHDGSSPDYTCSCEDPYTGSAQAGAAVCKLDECTTFNASVCVWSQQACNDTDLTTLDTWMCLCPSPAHGFESLGLANCTLDECVEECDHCENDACAAAGQECNDPNPSWLAEQDWTCTCKPPQKGSATGSPASCACDECEGENACASANQTCSDDNTACGGAASDYTCYCVFPLQGSAVGEAAMCYADECDLTRVCEDARQVCKDPDHFAWDDWYCECPEGTVGSSESAAEPVVKCELNECVAACASCANATCTDAKQGCRDADTDMNSLRDWVCTCPSPSTTQASLGVAVCQFDECTRDPCTPNDCPTDALRCSQTCLDHDQALDSTGDFFCVCPYPATEIVKGKPADCIVEPCYHESEAACVDDDDARCQWVLEPEPHCEKEPCTSEGVDSCLADDRCSWGPISPPGKYSEGMPGVLLYAAGEKIAVFDEDACAGSATSCLGCSAEQSGLFVTIADGFVRGQDGLACAGCEALGIGWNFSASDGGLQLSAGKGAALTAALASVAFETTAASTSKRSFTWGFGSVDAPEGGCGASVDALLAGCFVEQCVNDTQAACELDSSCRWVGSTALDPCVVEHCAGKRTERDCESDSDCVFEGSCKLKYCSGLQTARDCVAGGCAWDVAGQRCFEKDCGAHGADRCGCRSDALCYWDAAAARCVAERYGICPVMDVVVLIPGTSTMAASFGSHPHGFYALTEMLRDWVGSVPLTGELGWSNGDASNGGIRVCIVQFAGGARGAVGLVTPAETGTAGSLSGDAAELSDDVSWHEDQFLSGAPSLSAGLQKAVTVYAAAAAEPPRKKVVLVLSDVAVDDEAECKAPLAQLHAGGAVVFAAALRKRGVPSEADASAEDALAGLVGGGGAATSVQLEDVPGVLDMLCNPQTAWGYRLNPAAASGAHGPCSLHANRSACTADPGCAFDGTISACGSSACTSHCDEARCLASDVGPACVWAAVSGEEGCWAAEPCSHGSNETRCRSDPACEFSVENDACNVRPCAFPTEGECAASSGAAACAWDSEAGTCRQRACAYTTEDACGGDTTCEWNACDGCGLARRCEGEGAAACGVADRRCGWDAGNATCGLKPCASHSEAERCCKAEDRCVWDVSASPGACAMDPCSGYDGDLPTCEAAGGCAYDSATAQCRELVCSRLARCACVKHAEECKFDWEGGVCLRAAYATCPTMDVVVLIDGSSAMAGANDRHPIGFDAVAEILRDWVSDLPMPRIRVAALQYSSAASVLTPPGAAGSLSSDREAVRSGLAWHAEKFSGAADAPEVAPALAVARGLFGPQGEEGADRREKFVLVLGGSPVVDGAAVPAEVAALEAAGAAVLAVFVKNPGATVREADAAAASLSSISANYAAVSLEGLRDRLLAGFCDPDVAGFGGLVSDGGSPIVVCSRVAGENPCQSLSGCEWDDENAKCAVSRCLAHCDEEACVGESPATANCSWSPAAGGCTRASPASLCADLTTGGPAACAAEPTCVWAAVASTCVERPCFHSTEAGCRLSTADGRPCVWHSAAGECTPQLCTHGGPSECAADAMCDWIVAGGGGAGGSYSKAAAARPFEDLACEVSGDCGAGIACGSPVNGASVWVSAGFAPGRDVLSCAGCAGLGLTAVWQSESGVLHVDAGAATAATVAAALRTVEFSTDSDAFAPRNVSWNYGPGIILGDAQRLYRYHPCADGCSWEDASAACAAAAFGGAPGYLATVADESEADAVAAAFAGRAGWIGARGVSGLWRWKGDLAGEAVAGFEHAWASGEPSVSSNAAAYSTAPEGRWVSMAVGSTAGKGFLCEWRQELTGGNPPCEAAAGSVRLAAASCQVSSDCAATATPAACTRKPGCRWAPETAACAVHPCAELPTEVACRFAAPDLECAWAVDSSPARCVGGPCERQADRDACLSVSTPAGICAWDDADGVCTPAACGALEECACNANPGECYNTARNSLAEGGSGPGSFACVSAAYAGCPAMDVLLAFGGAAALDQAFSRRPHGYYAMLAMLDDWLAVLPLAGETGAEPPRSVRAALVQFSTGASTTTSSAYLAAAPYGVGAAGETTGDLAALRAELAWHADHFLGRSGGGGAPKNRNALAAGALLRPLAAAAPPSSGARRQVLLFIGLGGLAPGTASALAQGLSGGEITRLCVLIDGGRGGAGAAERDAWRQVASAPAAALRVVGLEELPGVLASVCDPEAGFGEVVLGRAAEPPAERPCAFHAERGACAGDRACVWSATTQACAESACLPHCTPDACSADASAGCTWDPATRLCLSQPPPGACAGITSPGTCGEAPGCAWNADREACADVPPCDHWVDAAACEQSEADPGCRWVGWCEAVPCGYRAESACNGAEGCGWVGEACVVVSELCADRSVEVCEAGNGPLATCVVAGESGDCVVNPAHATSCPSAACCVCKDSWSGAQCSSCAGILTAADACVSCTREASCSNHGACTAAGLCACDSGWSGLACADSTCAPPGASWYTLYPNQPLAGAEFTVIVHGCFGGDAAGGNRSRDVKLVDRNASCADEVAAGCTVSGPGAVLGLRGECARGMLGQLSEVEKTGQELLVHAVTHPDDGQRDLKVCGVTGQGEWSEVRTHSRAGTRVASFAVAQAPGKDTGAVAAAAAPGGGGAGCYDGFAAGSVRLPLAVVVVCFCCALVALAAAAVAARRAAAEAQVRKQVQLLEPRRSGQKLCIFEEDDMDLDSSHLFSGTEYTSRQASQLSASQLGASLLGESVQS